MMLVAALFAAPLLSRADEPQKVTFDASGSLIVNSFGNRGDMDARDLPRFALVNGTNDQRAFGLNARQSRLRASVGIPADGFLAGAALKGFVEGDFAGGNVTTDTVNPRLRHYYVSSTWKNMSNLSVLVGQTWGVAGGAYFPESQAHWVMPRFGGAGFMFRRAPQIRVSGDVPVSGPVTLTVTAAALQPGDNTLSGSSASSATPGNDSAFPNFEGRVAGAYKMNGKPLAELGLWTHYGRDKFEVAAGGTPTIPFAQDVVAKSQAFGVDVRVTLPYVQFIGHAFQGQNLDVLASIAGMKGITPNTVAASGPLNFTSGVLIDKTDPANVKAVGMKTKGGFLQAVVSPVKNLQVLLGAGMENPDDATLKLSSDAAIADSMITRNTQLSAGTVVAVSSKWKVGFEATRYLTTVSRAGAPNNRDVQPATQFELGSVVTF